MWICRLTLGRALEMRYDLIREQMAQRINALKSDTIKQVCALIYHIVCVFTF